MGFLDRALDKGERGPDLQLWGHDRGLDYVPEADRIEGIALNMGGLLQSNICIGKLDGAEMGVVFHQSDRIGSHHGDRWLEFTRFAVRVPEALAPLQAFVVSNGPSMETVADGFRPTPDLGKLEPASIGLGTRSRSGGVAGLVGLAPRWQVTVRMGTDTGIYAQLMGGALGEALESYDGGLVLDYRYGTLTFTHADGFLGPGPQLDAGVELVCLAARELRAAALEHARPQPFAAALPEPQGAGGSMEDQLGHFTKGGTFEDPLAFHAAFPSCPAPGVAWAVWRKEVDGRPVRCAINTEGEPARGPCVTMLEVSAGEDRPGPITTTPGALAVAVKDGVMAAWMYREQGNVAQIEVVEQQALQVAAQQGWLT
jgi:hypothetical protein